jgi:hypothetical protein
MIDERLRIRNPPDLYVRADGPFEPVVDVSLFEAAREVIAARSHRLTDEESLKRLSALLVKSAICRR